MITNGFDIDKVMAALQGRIGWIQPTLANSPVISVPNKASSSGRYYNDGSFHASCTIQKLKDVQEDPAISDNDFNTLLTTLGKSATMRCLNAVFNRNQLIEKTLVYERSSNVRNIAIPNSGNACGFRIKVAQGDYAAMINTVSLFFNGVATFNLYLFNDLKLAPLQTKSVTTAANDQTIVQLDWQLDYVESTNKGGIFYVLYFQNDLPSGVMAMDEQLNIWADSKIFGAIPFQSPQIGTSLDFNRTNPSVVFRSYGLNLEISSFRDYTSTIVQNANLFDEARGLTMAVIVLDQIKNSIRSNDTQRQAMSQVQMTEMRIDTDLAFPTKETPFVAGLKQQIMREFKRINETFFPKQEAVSLDIRQSDPVFGYDSFDLKSLPPREQFY